MELPNEVSAVNLKSNPWDVFRDKIQGQEVRDVGPAEIIDFGSIFFTKDPNTGKTSPRTFFRGDLGSTEYTNQLQAMIKAGEKCTYVYRVKCDQLPAPGKAEVSEQTLVKKLGTEVPKAKVGDKVVLTAWQTEKGAVLFGFRTR